MPEPTGLCICKDLSKSPWAPPKLMITPRCPVHGDKPVVTALGIDPDRPLPPDGWEGCVCRVIDNPDGTTDLSVHEDCPQHWREQPDE